MAGLVRENSPKGLRKLLVAERLWQLRVVLETRRKPTRPVPRSKNDRHPASAKEVGDGKNCGPADIHIEDGNGIDLALI
jgi:hypothetical protein